MDSQTDAVVLIAQTILTALPAYLKARHATQTANVATISAAEVNAGNAYPVPSIRLLSEEYSVQNLAG